MTIKLETRSDAIIYIKTCRSILEDYPATHIERTKFERQLSIIEAKFNLQKLNHLSKYCPHKQN